MKILEAYQNIKNKHQHMPPLSIGACDITEEIIKSLKELDKRLEEIGFDQGWLCYQSKILKLEHAQTLQAQTKDGGVLLYGELATKNKSWHIRQHLQGTWKLITLTETATDSTTATHLYEDMHFVAMPEADQTELPNEIAEDAEAITEYLHYRRYSQCSDAHGYEVYTARFIGFSDTNKEV